MTGHTDLGSRRASDQLAVLVLVLLAVRALFVLEPTAVPASAMLSSAARLPKAKASRQRAAPPGQPTFQFGLNGQFSIASPPPPAAGSQRPANGASNGADGSPGSDDEAPSTATRTTKAVKRKWRNAWLTTAEGIGWGLVLCW